MFDPDRHFQESAAAYGAILEQDPLGDYESVVGRLRGDAGLPRLFFELYKTICRDRQTFVQVLEYPPFTYVYDSPSLQGYPGDDRTVAAIGSSQARYSLSELLEMVDPGVAGPQEARGASRLLIQLLTDFAHRLPSKRLAAFRSAAANVIGLPAEGGRASVILRRLDDALREPTPELLAQIKRYVVPVLGDVLPPRSERARRNYRKFGGMDDMDLGHLISHAAGGPPEINTFPQNRPLNRGWSVEGKKYRVMEAYIAANPGILHFSRPVYPDETWVPRYLEFGVLVPRTDVEKLPFHDGDHVGLGRVALLRSHPESCWWLGVFNNERGSAT